MPSVWSLELQAPFEELTLRKFSEADVREVVQEGLHEDRVGFLTRAYYDWVSSSKV